MKFKEVSLLINRKISVNYQSIGLSIGTTIECEGQPPSEVYKVARAFIKNQMDKEMKTLREEL